MGGRILFRYSVAAAMAMVVVVVVGVAGCASGGATSPRPSTAGAPTTTGAGNAPCVRENEIFGPTRVSAETYASRTGADASTFSALGITSKQRPMEECGLDTVLRRLVSLRCDGGLNPFERDERAAHASRAGSFGPGGRCDSIIDRYDVKCPERTYELFVDMYVCPPGLS